MRVRMLFAASLLSCIAGCGSSDDTSDGGGTGATGGAAATGGASSAGAGGTGSSGGKAGAAGKGGSAGSTSGGSGGTAGGGKGGSSGTAAGGSAGAGIGGSSGSSPGGSSGSGTGGSGTGGSGTGGGGTGGSSSLPIGEWTDAPGVCPSGAPQKDLTTLSQLEDASRGENDYSGDAPDTCYLVHDGTYTQSGSTLPIYIKVGGTDAAHRRVFVGQSRHGVIIKGRGTIDMDVSHVQLANLTFDLNGYSQSGSFNTLSMLGGSVDLRIDHVDFTGDCMTGASGGHVEVDGSSDVVVEACLIEKFGHCGPAGHQDHGVYLASGSGIVIRNNDIRGNASRGLQMNTEGGSFGTLLQITVTQNRIHDNGHGDYEDGIVMNATGTGDIGNVTIQHNLFYTNYYSGVRVVGTAFQAIDVSKNTFFQDGVGSSAPGRSEANIDSPGSGASTVFSKNIFVAQSGIGVLDSCYDATPRGYALTDNVTVGTVPAGSDGACVTGSKMLDPLFASPATFDFHTMNAAVGEYGAYAP